MPKPESFLIYELELESPELELVSPTAEKLTGFLKDHGVDDGEFLEAFQTALVEALNNAVKHGCKDTSQPFVRATLRLQVDQVVLNIADPSRFCGWEGRALLPEDPMTESGRGRFLIEQMTDWVRHDLQKDGHVLTIGKMLPSGHLPYQPGEPSETLQAMTEELASSYEMISTLTGLGEWLTGANDMESMMAGTLERLCLLTGAGVAYVRVARQGMLDLICRRGAPIDPLSRLPLAGSRGVEVDVFLSGEELTLPDNSDLPDSDPLRPLLSNSFITPVLFKGTRQGVLVLGQTSPSLFFHAGQLKVTRVVAEYLGIIHAFSELQKQRNREARALRDLEIATDLQMSLMPPVLPTPPGLQVFGSCIPANMAGGDYYDFATAGDGSLIVIIADVMGKGLPAAILATMFRTNFHATLDQASNPAEMLTNINRLMISDLQRVNMFITARCLWITPDRSTIWHAGAGHPPGLLLHPPDQFTLLAENGVPIGILSEASYESFEKDFQPGATLCLFTDGLTEAFPSQEEGLLVVRETMQKNSVESAKKTANSLLKAAASTPARAVALDDQTVVCIYKNSPP